MHKWRERHPGHPDYVKKAAGSTFGEMSDEAEASDAAESVYDTATKHRETVIAKDKAAKARRKAGRRG